MIDIFKTIYVYSITASYLSCFLLRNWPKYFEGQDVYKTRDLTFFFVISFLPVINTLVAFGNTVSTLALLFANFLEWLIKIFYKENQ